jgi:hypothetical protein
MRMLELGRTNLFGATAESGDDLALHLERVGGLGAGIRADDAWTTGHGEVARR